MYAKKFFTFSSKPFSLLSSSFSSFFSFLNISSSDSSDYDYSEQASQKKEYNFYQIHSQTSKELLNSYEKWIGKMNLSHNMLENKPCKMTLTKNSLFENALGYFSQVNFLNYLLNLWKK